jgi:hypothetical protein
MTLRLLSLILLSVATLQAADDAALKALQAADDERVSATVAADHARLADLFSDGLRYAHSTGTVDTKTSLIETLTSGRTRYESIRYEERTFHRLSPGVALMTGRAAVKVTAAGVVADSVLSFLAVWCEEKGKWRFRAWQSCKIPVQTSAETLPTSTANLPTKWDAKRAGDEILSRLIKVTAPQAKGAHDAEFVCVGDRAYIVEHDNNVEPGHGAGAAQYCVLSIVNLKTLEVEKTIPMAKSEQVFDNVTLPKGMCFVPRIIRKDDHTLRTYFCSQPAKEQALTWYRDFDLGTQTFKGSIHKAKLKTAAGVFDMEPRHFHADAAALGFKRKAVNQGLFIFDSFKEFDSRRYVALNNFPGKQNALAVLHDDFTTFEVIGHYNEPQSQQISESAVNRLPDGTWMAICRNDAGNYHFTTSKDGKTWTIGQPMPFVPNGLNSKPTFDKFGDVYYLGWQENTKVENCGRSVFNVDISRDGRVWERKYRFESPHSFQYPTFHEHEGAVWLTVTQSDHKGSSDRIMFGKLESLSPAP